MAVTFADLSSDETTYLGLDKPIIGASVLLTTHTLEWRTSGSFASGSDATDASYPAIRAADGKTHLHTRPASNQTTWYYMLNTGTTTISFDFIVIIGHFFGTDSTTVSVEVADNNAFTTNLREIASWTPSDDNRLVDLSLLHTGADAQRYSTVQFLRVKTTGASHKPEIGELFLGRRRQLKHKPNLNWDSYGRFSESANFVSQSGVVTRYTHHKGRRDIVANFNPHETAFQTDFTDWFEQIDYGQKPFIWIDDPSTTPGDAHLMMMTESSMEFPFVGPNERTLLIEAREQGPDFLSLES